MQPLLSRRSSSVPARLKTPITTTSITHRSKLDIVKDMTTYFTLAPIHENETTTLFVNFESYLANLARLPKSLIEIHLKACLQSDPHASVFGRDFAGLVSAYYYFGGERIGKIAATEKTLWLFRRLMQSL